MVRIRGCPRGARRIASAWRRIIPAAALLATFVPPTTAQQTSSVTVRSAEIHGVGLVADGQASREEAGVGRWERTIVTFGVGATIAGWKLTLAGGRFAYAFPGGGEGALPMTTIDLGRDLGGLAGGTLSLSFRHTVLWDPAQRLDIGEVHLGWRLRF